MAEYETIGLRSVGVKIRVYLDDGRVCEYEVEDAKMAESHASRIRYRGLIHNDGKIMEWYPPHRILKIRFPAGGSDYRISKWRET